MSEFKERNVKPRSAKRKLTKEEKRKQSELQEIEYIKSLRKQYEDAMLHGCNANDVEDTRAILYFKTGESQYRPYTDEKNETDVTIHPMAELCSEMGNANRNDDRHKDRPKEQVPHSGYGGRSGNDAETATNNEISNEEDTEIVSEKKRPRESPSTVNIIEIESDDDIGEVPGPPESPGEIKEEPCCDNGPVRGATCPIITLDNSGNQTRICGFRKKNKRCNIFPYKRDPTQYANTSMEMPRSSTVNTTRTKSMHCTTTEGANLIPSCSHYAEDTLVQDDSNAQDVNEDTQKDSECNAGNVNIELRLNTLLQGNILKTPLSTLQTLFKYLHAHLYFNLDWVPDDDIVTSRPSTSTRNVTQIRKNTFCSYLINNCVINARHYDNLLETDNELRELEYQIDVRVLESTKKTIFRQNYLKIRNNDLLTPRIVICDNDARLGAIMFLLSHIATQNAMSVQRLRHLLASFIFNLNYKKRGLILCGPSDSAKTFFANLLYSKFQPHEIGYFNCPTGPSPSAFMLQSLSNALVYRCDEMVFEHLGVIQQMKQLLEGSKTLTTDVKYKDSLAIDPHPTLITMNSSSKYDILKWHPSEFQAFENRCTILWFGCPLTNILTPEELIAISSCGDELLYLLHLSKTNKLIEENNVLDKFKEYIL